MSFPEGEGYADLHLHSNRSDGKAEPGMVVRRAAERGLRALSLTDHDTTAGLEEAQRSADEAGIEFVNGVELTAHSNGRVVHILGYFIDPRAASLGAHADEMSDLRERRVGAMLERLAALNLPLTIAAVREQAGDAPIGRPHVAAALCRAGAARSVAEVFRRWLYDGGPADVQLMAPDVATVVARIHDAGGVAVLAHPAASGASEDEVEKLCAYGLDGVESRHAEQSQSSTRHWAAVARRFGLAESGGSDDHGHGRAKFLRSVPYGWVELLRERCSA